MNKNSKIFIAGHNGLVGSAVQRLFKSKGYKNLITISRKDLDLKDKKKVENFFKKKKNRISYYCSSQSWWNNVK